MCIFAVVRRCRSHCLLRLKTWEVALGLIDFIEPVGSFAFGPDTFTHLSVKLFVLATAVLLAVLPATCV